MTTVGEKETPGTAGEHADGESAETAPEDAFGALSDSVRLKILQSLVDHRLEADGEPAGFADLRRSVGVRDSGRFRYHLNQLRDTFVERVDGGGYRLTHAGQEVVAAIRAGRYTDEVSAASTTLDSECSLCGSAVAVAYESSHCVVTCEQNHPMFQWPVPPNLAGEADSETVLEVAQLAALHAVELLLAGVCPECYDPLEPTLDRRGDDSLRFRAQCGVCGCRVDSSVTLRLLADPAVAAVCRRHGVGPRDAYLWEPPFVGDDEAVSVADTDPLVVTASLQIEAETLDVSLDAAGRVTSVEER